MIDRSTAIVTVYIRQDCGLCEEAEVALRRLAPALRLQVQVQVQVVDVDADPALAARFGDVLPVIAVGETVVASAPIDEPALIAALMAL